MNKLAFDGSLYYAVYVRGLFRFDLRKTAHPWQGCPHSAFPAKDAEDNIIKKPSKRQSIGNFKRFEIFKCDKFMGNC